MNKYRRLTNLHKDTDRFRPGDSEKGMSLIKSMSFLILRSGTEGSVEHLSSQEQAHLLGQQEATLGLSQ